MTQQPPPSPLLSRAALRCLQLPWQLLQQGNSPAWGQLLEMLSHQQRLPFLLPATPMANVLQLPAAASSAPQTFIPIPSSQQHALAQPSTSSSSSSSLDPCDSRHSPMPLFTWPCNGQPLSLPLMLMLSPASMPAQRAGLQPAFHPHLGGQRWLATQAVPSQPPPVPPPQVSDAAFADQQPGQRDQSLQQQQQYGQTLEQPPQPPQQEPKWRLQQQHPKRIMSRITAAHSLQALHKVLQQNGPHFNATHIAAFLNRLARHANVNDSGDSSGSSSGSSKPHQRPAPTTNKYASGAAAPAGAPGQITNYRSEGSSSRPAQQIQIRIKDVAAEVEQLAQMQISCMDIGQLSSLVWGLGKLRERHEHSQATLASVAARLAADLAAWRRQQQQQEGGGGRQDAGSSSAATTTASSDSGMDAGSSSSDGSSRLLLDSAQALDVANLAWGLARLQCQEEAAWQWLSQASRQACPSPGAGPRELASLAWAFATAGRADESLFQCIETALEARGQTAAVAGVHTCPPTSKARPSGSPGQHSSSNGDDGRGGLRLRSRGPQHLASQPLLQPSELSGLLWALAVCKADNPRLSSRLQGEAALLLESLTPRQASTVCWSLANCPACPPAPSLMERLAGLALGRMAEFGPQDLAMLAWGLAAAHTNAPAFMRALAARVVAAARSGGSCGWPWPWRDLSMLAWALARGGCQDIWVFGELQAALRKQLAQCDPPALAHATWAFAAAGAYDRAFFTTLCSQLSRPGAMSSFPPDHLSPLAWALASSQHYDSDLMQALTARAQGCMMEMSPGGLANVAWALARLDHEGAGGFMEAAARLASKEAAAFEARDMAKLLWAFAKMGANAEGLFQAAAPHLAPQLPQLSAVALSNVAWAYASQGCRHDALFLELAAQAMARINEFSEQQAERLAKSFKSLGYDNARLITKLWRESQG